MLRLNIRKESIWVEFPGNVRLKLKPVTNAVITSSQAWATLKIRDMLNHKKEVEAIGAVVQNFPDLELDHIKTGIIADLTTKAVGINIIEDWEGVYLPKSHDHEEDVKAPLTEENICSLLDHYLYAERFSDEYMKLMAGIQQEGKSSAPSLNGTSEKVAEEDIVMDVLNKIYPAQKEKED